MLSCIPRSDPGAVIASLRPNGYGVSAPAGKLPYGSLPRLVLLGLYAEVLRTGEHSVDLGYAFCDYLYALGLREALELPEQAERLFRCTLRFDGWTSRLSWLSMLEWDNAYDDRWRGIIPQRDTRVALTAPVAEAMLRRPVRLCMHSRTGRRSTRRSRSTCTCGTPATVAARSLRRAGWMSTERSPSTPCNARTPTRSPPSSTRFSRCARRLRILRPRSGMNRRVWCRQHQGCTTQISRLS